MSGRTKRREGECKKETGDDAMMWKTGGGSREEEENDVLTGLQTHH